MNLYNSLKKNKYHITYLIVILIVALVYAISLIYLIPMEGIKDRENYLVYASSSDAIQLRYYSLGVLNAFTNEPIWLFINIILGNFLLPEQTISLIIFFSAFISSFLILKSNPHFFIFLLFILFFPQIIGKYIIHLRQGLAITIFLLGWFSTSKPWRIFWLSLTPFIHASFFFILFLLIYTHFLKKIKLAIDLRIIAVIVSGLALGLSLEYIVVILGARQADEYTFSSENISGLGFLFWLGIFILYWSQGYTFINKNTFAMVVMAFYLSTYFLIEVTGRVFESSVIIVLLASLDLTAWRKNICFFMIISFELLGWFIRLDQPWFGWGTGL